MAAKQCTKCGEAKPLEQFYRFKLGKLGRQAECKICSDARRRKFAKTRPEAERHSRRLWEKNNPEIVKASGAKKRANQSYKQRMKEYGAVWYAENRDRLRPIRAAWHAENYEEHRKPKMVQNEANRRARLRRAGGSHTLEQVMALLNSQRSVCACCPTSIASSFHRDHIVPLASGGSNDISNIQLLCPPCNRSKGARSMDQFLKTRSLNKEDDNDGRRRREPQGLVNHGGE